MLIRTGFDIDLAVEHPTAFLLLLSIHPSRDRDLRSPHSLSFSTDVGAADHVDMWGNVVTRIVAPPGVTAIRADFTVFDDGAPDPVDTSAVQHPVEDLPDACLPYLLGSRYCETDRLGDLAWSIFASVPPGWARVQAIVDYAHERIRFDYALARPTRTAFEAHEECVGVCRDFAHLAVALCRCMNIPARYCTGYLGDIGVPPVDYPMDFSAWFDVFLGGRWWTFDARHNTPRMGRILMARGRDATDVALFTSFGAHRLARFDVHTDEVPA